MNQIPPWSSRNDNNKDSCMEFLEWDLSQQIEWSETLHKEAMKKLDLELAQEELLACRATVTHTQAIQKLKRSTKKNGT